MKTKEETGAGHSSFARLGLVAGLIILGGLSTFAQQYSGFLSDYSPLKPMEGVANSLIWIAPDIEQKYTHAIFEQPEIFLDPQSKYKGIKPDEFKALADTFQDILATQALERGHGVAERPGPKVIRVRSALTNVLLKKQSTFVHYPTSSSAVRLKAAIGRSVSLVEATLEVELLDSVSGRRLALIVSQEGQRKIKELGVREYPSSWSEFVTHLEWLGQTIDRRLGSIVGPAQPPQ